MSDGPIMSVSRNERRKLLRAEARNRKDGTWGDWECVRFPRGSAGSAWAAGFDKAHRNRVFSVLDQSVGAYRHLMISSLSGDRPTWTEAQRIKNELAGQAATAVEVYPPQSEVVDDADAYHLWIMPDPLPFGLRNPASQP